MLLSINNTTLYSSLSMNVFQENGEAKKSNHKWWCQPLVTTCGLSRSSKLTTTPINIIRF